MPKKIIASAALIFMLCGVISPAFALKLSRTKSAAPVLSIAESEEEAKELISDLHIYEAACKVKYSDKAEYMAAIYEKAASYSDVTEIAWDDDDTFVFTMSKGMRAVYDYEASRIEFSDDDIISKTETIRFGSGSKANYNSTTDAVMFGPFYGIQSEFNYYYELYQQVCDITAEHLGGTSIKILGRSCTPRVLREYGSKAENAVVIFSGHGECVGTCSYVNAYSSDGITQEDINAGNAMISANHPGYYLVNGNYITNNRTADLSVNSIWWFAACEGMMSRGLCDPLRECGAGCVFGYSRSVTFNYEIDFSYAFWDKYTDGVTVKEAAAYAKSKAGAYDRYYSEHARPIFVSVQDAYVNNTAQNVQCALSYAGYPEEYLPQPPKSYNITFVSEEEGFTVSNLPDTIAVCENIEFTLPESVPTRVRDANPSVSGGTFAGWQIKGAENAYQPGDTFLMPSENVTLVALWKDVEFAVTYKCAGADMEEVYVYNTEVTVADDKTADEYLRFDGWISDFDGKLYNAGDTFSMPYRDVAMTAQYTKLYTVTFKDFDGTVICVQKTADGEAAQAPEAPEHTGFVFTGWDKDFSCITEDMEVTAAYIMLGDVNSDGKVNTADATVILKASAGMIALDGNQKIAADLNKNGYVNTADATYILKYAAGMVVGL